MALKLITPPETEPVSLLEAKLHLRLEADYDTEDDLLNQIIVSAREWCEGFQNRAYLTQTLESIMDAFPSGDLIELPRPPLQSVTSVKYTDSDGTVMELTANTDYVADTDTEPGRIFLPYGTSWPSATLLPYGAVRVRFVAGHTDAASVPARVKQAMLLLIGHWYEHREAVLVGSISKEIELAVKALLGLDRVVPV